MSTIDLRSDTVTRPTAAMRKAMAEAEVGDDLYGEDPTVNRLQEEAARRLGFDKALLVPSGTMANEIAIRLLTEPGQLVLAEERSHVVQNEMAGMAVLSGVAPTTVSAADGKVTPDHIRRANKPPLIVRPVVGLVVLENTHNFAGGTVYTVAETRAAVAAAREAGWRVHLDGARLWNAAVALGVPPRELAAGVDTVMVDLSKGLCCPIGALLLLPSSLYDKARRVRQQLGGGMRQAGVIAAPGLVALDTMIDRLAEDHANARLLGDALARCRGVRVAPGHSNIVIAQMEGRRASDVAAALAGARGARPRPRSHHPPAHHPPRRLARGLRARGLRAAVRPGPRVIPVVALVLLAAGEPAVERDVPVRMRDGVVLRADLWRPAGKGPFPVLVYRTPYGKRGAPEDYTTVRRAVARGYAVVVQDVRGRYASEGEFDPYRHEGKDGYDTIEWAATQPWSNGKVGTFGLSYPGAVQWLAAVESPPHLLAMVPAMTFSRPDNFFYSGGVFDLSWIDWIWNNIAPDTRARKNLAGPRTDAEAEAAWPKVRDDFRSRLPLSALDEIGKPAPYYFTWMSKPPGDPYWDFADLRRRYDKVSAAVLNFSGWYDEAYGPEGAITNFLGLLGRPSFRRGPASAARARPLDPRKRHGQRPLTAATLRRP